MAAAVAAFHVVDHRLVEARFHLLTHVSAGVAATAAAHALGADARDLGLERAKVRPSAKVGALASALPVLGLAAASFIPSADDAMQAQLRLLSRAVQPAPESVEV